MRHTENYNFNLYDPTDLANLTDGYNNSMEKIDSSLKAVEDYVQTQDAAIEQNAADIVAEKTRAVAAEKAVSDAVSAEITRAKGAESTLTTNLNAEVTRAKGAESTLTTNLNAEITRAKGVENELATGVSNAITQIGNVSKYIADETNPISYGADPTGASDSSSAINACISANRGSVINFTPGVYKCSSPIKTPYKSTERVSIKFNGSKLLFDGSANYDYALGIGKLDSDSTVTSGEENNNYYSMFSDFTIVTNSSYKYAIATEYWYKASVINNFKVVCANNGLLIGGSGKPSDVRLLNGFVYASSFNSNSIGIQSVGSDNQYTQLRVYNFGTGIETCGGDRISGVHLLTISESNINNTVGMHVKGQVVISDVYFDTFKYGAKIEKDSGLIGNCLYFYSWSDKLQNRIGFYFVDNATGTKLSVSNISVQTRTSESAYPFTTIRQVFSNDDTANQVSITNVNYIGSNSALDKYDYLKIIRNNNIKASNLVTSNTWCEICKFRVAPWNTVGLIFSSDVFAYISFRLGNDNPMTIEKKCYKLNTATNTFGVGITAKLQDGFIVGSIYAKNSSNRIPNITISAAGKYFDLISNSVYELQAEAGTPSTILFEQ